MKGARSKGGRRYTGKLSMFYGLASNGPAWYGVLHDEGKGRLPRRPLIDLTDRTRLRFMRALQDHLIGR